MDKPKRSPALQKAQAKYEQKRATKLVTFNKVTELDLLQTANELPNFSVWVKAQLKNIQQRNK